MHLTHSWHARFTIISATSLPPLQLHSAGGGQRACSCCADKYRVKRRSSAGSAKRSQNPRPALAARAALPRPAHFGSARSPPFPTWSPALKLITPLAVK